MKIDLRIALVTLAIVAAILGLITAYIVFYGGGGTYVVSSPIGGPDAQIFSTSTTNNATSSVAGSTASSTLSLTSSSPEGSSSSSSISTAPAVTWTQGNETMSVTGATLSGTQLALSIQVQMGSASECVPLTLRLIADEQGDLSPPITQQFSFPDTGSCNGTPGETYSGQQVVFTVADPSASPFLLTTGGTANILFEVVQNPDGSLTVQLPPKTG